MPLPTAAPQKGYNTNLASEFYVLSMLYRLGLDANLALGNKKSVDITVVLGPGQAVTIDVKAVAGKMDWLMGSTPDSPKPNHYVVLVSYEGRFSDAQQVPRCWVLRHESFSHLSRRRVGRVGCAICRARTLLPRLPLANVRGLCCSNEIRHDVLACPSLGLIRIHSCGRGRRNGFGRHLLRSRLDIIVVRVGTSMKCTHFSSV